MGPGAPLAGGGPIGGGRMVSGARSTCPGGGALLPVRAEADAGATGEGGALGAVTKWPHVTQKRRLRGFLWPQSGQGAVSWGEADAGLAPAEVASRSTRPAKLTSGAGGRCGMVDGLGASDARGSPGGTCGEPGGAAAPDGPAAGVEGATAAGSL